ncbi:MAG: DNA polymerase IV [Acidimicrobiales bacterium]|nr:DNA polymerase IV [Acidimicrobiales bacterium]
MSAPRELGFLHVDMDAFFVSVELLRRPELRGQPVVVGGRGRRGVVAAASYEARSFGVFSAMSSVEARRRCPQAIFLPGDHARYAEVSGRVMAILRSYTPLVEPLSLDEAFLDVRPAYRERGDGPSIARSIRREIHEQESLTCSVGVAAVKFLAKLGSVAAKPKATADGPVYGSGVHVIDVGTELAFLHPLPAKALWGVGPKTLAKLERLGVQTIGDVAAVPEPTLISLLGQASGRHLHQLANGIDHREVEADQKTKSISHEETFEFDLRDPAPIDREILRMSEAVASRLRKSNLAGRTVQLKLRFGDFTTLTRSVTVPNPIDDGADIVRAARSLIEPIDTGPGLRLLGVGVSGLVDGTVRQLSLDDLAADDRTGPEGAAARKRATPTVDAIRDKFGDDAIGPAVLAKPARDGGSGLDLKRAGAQHWGPDRADGEESGES